MACRHGHSEEVRDSRLYYIGCANNHEHPLSYRLLDECAVVLSFVETRLETSVGYDVVIFDIKHLDH